MSSADYETETFKGWFHGDPLNHPDDCWLHLAWRESSESIISMGVKEIAELRSILDSFEWHIRDARK